VSQDDILNGRLICLIGIAPVRLAEFVIFRVGHHADEGQRSPSTETSRSRGT